MELRFDRDAASSRARLCRLARPATLALLATLALWAPPAWAEPTAPIEARVGNHTGFGRLVLEFPARTAYQQARTGDHLSLRFAGDVTITPPAHPPNNVDAVAVQPGEMDLTVLAGSTTHIYWLGDRLVVDVLDPVDTASAQQPQTAPPTQGQPTRGSPTPGLPNQGSPGRMSPIQAPLTQGAADRGSSGQGSPGQGSLTQGAPTRELPPERPPQAAAAALPLPLPPPPTPPAPPAPAPPASLRWPASSAAAALDPAGQTVVSAAPGGSAAPMPPTASSPPAAGSAGSPGTPANRITRAADQRTQSPTQPPSQSAAPPPVHPLAPPPVQPLAPAPTQIPTQPAASAGTPITPVAVPATTGDAPKPAATLLALPFPTSVGVAAFRRGDSALVVFDERRPIDLAGVRADPVFGAATVTLLPEATVLRLKLPADRSLAVSQTQSAWRLGVVDTPPPARPIPMRAADGQLGLPADAVGAVVAIADPDTGATLLVGTQRAPGQDFPTLRQTPEFSLLPTWQGIVVEPLTDRLVMRADNDGFLLTAGRQGLAMAPSSTGLQAQADAAAMTRQFDLRSQPLATLVARLHRQVLAAAMAPPLARGPLRAKAAETMIALGFGAEAQAMLRLAVADDPALGASANATGLGAIAALLAGRDAEAGGIDDPRLTGSDEVMLWRAVRAAEQTPGSPLAAAAFAVTTPLIAVYPAALRDRLLPLAFETMIEGGQTATASRLLAHQPDDDHSLDLARGMLRAADGDTDGALAIYDKLANDPNRLVHARAAVRAVERRLAAGRIDTAHAADALDRLLYAWRGGRRELALRERIADLREKSGAWTAALSMLHETETLFPDAGEAVHARLKAAFARLLEDKALDRLAPLELVSMVEENASLLPDGPAGEALEERLADRLLALDLPERAAPVLEKLMVAAPSPAGRAGFGARLAALRLQEDDAKGALAALAASADTTQAGAGVVSVAAPLAAPPANSPAASAAASVGGSSAAPPSASTGASSGASLTASAAASPPGSLTAPSPAPSSASLPTPLPASLVERRTLLEADARARLGDRSHAVAELAALGTTTADLAQATILEQAKDWPGAEHALADYVGKAVPPTGALDQAQQQVLVRYATAAAQAGDEATLATLRTSDSPRMPGGAFGDMFRLLTAAPVEVSGDLPRAVRETTLAHDLPKALDALKPPTGTP